MARINAVLALSSLNGTNGFRIDGVAAGDESGFSVASAGDVNRDGFADLIIGAPGASLGGRSDAGSSYVVFGRSDSFGSAFALSSLNGSNGFRLEGPTDNASLVYAGYSVASAGDVNGDGFSDVIVGAPYLNQGNGDEGASYVVFGRSSGFSASIATSSLNGANGFRLDGFRAPGRSGSSVASAGDINGDGFADLIVGAPNASRTGIGQNVGQSYVVFGRSGGFASTLNVGTLNGTNGFSIDGVAGLDLSGFSVSAAGDLNGDGIGDLVVGAYAADPGGRTGAGSSYVVYGRRGGFGSSLPLSSLNGTTGFRIDGAAVSDGSGGSVSRAGDVNGDGVADLIIGTRSGASNTPGPAGENVGDSYVVFGRTAGFGSSLALSSLNGTNGFRLDDDGTYLFGAQVSSAGDVNGDGFGDVIVTNQRDRNLASSTDAYVVYGRPGGFGSVLSLSTINGRNGFRIGGNEPGEAFISSVSAAGDVNGDGFGDLIVGDRNASPGGKTYAGSSYVIYGAPSRVSAGDFNHDLTSDLLLQNGGTVADWILGNGAYQSGNTLTTGATGYTVVGRGDVNRDGTADIILQSGGTVVDWIMNNGRYQAGNIVTAGGAAGYSVRAVGDFDGDGTADLVLQSGNTVVQWRLRNGAYAGGGVLANAAGFTVVGAGDFDGDGTSDLLLQAGTGTVVQWRLQNGNYAGGGVLADGAGYGVVGTGDVNGDGTDDVVLQNGGTVVDWIMAGGQYRSGNIITTGASGYTVRAIGDYNGDGTDDLALQAGTGTVVQWSLRNGLYAGGGVLANGNGFTVV